MASSNRHWPSLFKSKPQHQWQQHEHNRTSVDSGCEERSKDPKPRWNPKPEQIRILEAIFNSGMVNPPRDEIRRIRVQLQEFGQVGDANVFYWFQNRKSRSKNRQQRNQTKSNSHTPITTTLTMLPPPSSSSNKSSQKASQKEKLNQTTVQCSHKLAPFSVNIMADASLNSPTASVNQLSFVHGEFLTEPEPEPFYFPVLSGGNHATTIAQGFRSAEISTSVIHQHNLVADDHTARNHSNLLLSDLLMNDGATNYKKLVQDEKNNTLQQQQIISYDSAAPTTIASNSIYLPPYTLPSIADNVQGKSTVVINEGRFEVPSGPLNVKEAFGDDAVLIHYSSGQPVVTDRWGVTLQPLQHGASYYLI